MNAEPLWKKAHAPGAWTLSLVCAAIFGAAAQAEIVLSVTPEENAPPSKGTITVPKPKDDASVKAAQKLGDALQFINNDVLHGSLLAIDAQTGVRWQNPEAKEPIEFKAVNVGQIRL